MPSRMTFVRNRTSIRAGTRRIRSGLANWLLTVGGREDFGSKTPRTIFLPSPYDMGHINRSLKGGRFSAR
jgi:hypothetical protein